METQAGSYLVIFLNALAIALVITSPLLLGLAVISVTRKGFRKDREKFESRVISLLEEIRDAQKNRS
jgi:hypothetical protein